jgi:hypothetical protein
MKRKLLTETPVCRREHLVIISYTTGLSFLFQKGSSHLLQLLLLSFIYSHFIYLHYQIPLKTRLLIFTVNPWSKPLVNTFCSSLGSTLLFIKSTTIHPLYLWVINDPAYHCMCSMQFVDVTPMKHHLTSITSIRVVQQKHHRSKVGLMDYNFIIQKIFRTSSTSRGLVLVTTIEKEHIED